MLRLLLAIAACAAAGAQGRPAGRPESSTAAVRTFESPSKTFRISVPQDWRQLSPGDARRLRKMHPDWPQEVQFTEPALFYAVGPIDRWLQGDELGVFLYVVEQDREWYLQGDELERALREHWAAVGAGRRTRYEVERVESRTVGRNSAPAVISARRHVPERAPERWSLDVHVPTGGRELSLSFQCPARDARAEELRFHEMLASLSLARPSKGRESLSDRLWTPILTGALVGAAILVLYRHMRHGV
ncbi:MAG: hypothetical protein Fur0037_28840 [Planctomycetota bacterium]